MNATVHRVAVLPGDGIGNEVVPAAQRVLERAGELHGFGFDWDELPWGCDHYLETGEMMPADGLDVRTVTDPRACVKQRAAYSMRSELHRATSSTLATASCRAHPSSPLLRW